MYNLLKCYWHKKTEKLFEHTREVENLCDDFISRWKEKTPINETPINEELLKRSAILHDIAKLDEKVKDREEHNSPDLVRNL